MMVIFIGWGNGSTRRKRRPAVSRKWYEHNLFCVLRMSLYFNVSYMYNNWFYYWFCHCFTDDIIAVGEIGAVLRGGWAPITRFSSATCYACPKQWLGIPPLYAVSLSMFNEVWWEVIVRFVDIVGSIHNYCLIVILQLQLMAELVSINFNVVIARCTRYNIMW
jgi:hypothetical protein